MIALPSPLAPLSRLLQPFVSAWVQDAWPRAVQSPLGRCLLLALLLHVWLVLMLGNAPPGTALPGQGVWGALNVTLRGPPRDGPVALPTPPVPPTGLPGTAATPRAGGTVRVPAAQPVPEPGAARRGDWAARPAPATLADVLPALQPAPEPVRLRPPAAMALPPPLAPLPAAPAPAAAALAPVVAPAVAALAEPAEPTPATPAWRQVAPMAAGAAAASALPATPLPAAQAPLGLPSLPAAPASVAQAVLPAGRPDAGPQVGHDVATAPSAPASAPRLNLELARPRGGELSRQSGTGVLALMPRPPEVPARLSRDIDKSAKADCRQAYQGLGVLAAVPLAVETLRGGTASGCKW